MVDIDFCCLVGFHFSRRREEEIGNGIEKMGLK